MDLFIIGDIHGCFFSYLELLEKWDPQKECLIQLGDQIDRGAFSPHVLLHSKQLGAHFPEQTVFLRGNHEQLMLDYYLKGPSRTWLINGGNYTLDQFQALMLNPKKLIPWLEDLPLTWENDHVLVSHAGFSSTETPLDPDNPNGVLWNRKPLLKLEKTQVIGHTPRMNGRAEYNGETQSWNIDTGAYRNGCLTGIKLRPNGDFIEEINIPTNPKDLYT
ncbi:metallophosphoesterase [Pararhodonellum marinum]|uniref:metallophosphoesterase n=1 Tax=Pararhodonellum marinum TaxID=2755358 RepID=UPI001890351E|nr:metallophosphoesterase [Pararhodonellum marinum]